MQEILIDYGLPAMFLLGFLAATLLPLGSEWLLVALLLKGLDPFATVVVATAGNSLGALTNYAIGLWGGPYLFQKVLRISSAELERAEKLYSRYGCWSLLLAWLPIVGDPLCLVGGVLKIGWVHFLLMVTTGKFCRYGFVAWAAIAMGAS
ncbi:MAG: hypothetical protein C0614_08935 [Desulfuromonas sp.]|nr:MAG: hypothetical protein C0614_08935 [Desulfuromonas sp.]